MMRCRAWYTDHHGTLEGVMTLGPDSFVLEVGGVRFEGDAPDSLTPTSHTPWALLDRFTPNSSQELCDCVLEWVQPMMLQVVELSAPCDVWMRVMLPPAGAPGTFAFVVLGLEYAGRMVDVSGGQYEDLLYRLYFALPDVRLRCCYTCARHELMTRYGTHTVGAGHCLLGHEVELAVARAGVDDGRGREIALYQLIRRVAAPSVSELHVCDAYTRTL